MRRGKKPVTWGKLVSKTEKKFLEELVIELVKRASSFGDGSFTYEMVYNTAVEQVRSQTKEHEEQKTEATEDLVP